MFLLAVPISADEIHSLDVPCRVLDTRNTVGYLSPGTTLDFLVRDTPGGSQGGESGCGVPVEATAVFINIIAISPSNNGWANIWAYGETIPLASVLNVTLAQTENVGTLAKLGVFGSASDLNLRNAGFSTYWVVDITGYVASAATTFVKGTITEKETTLGPPTVEFDLDTLFPGFRAICAEPWISVEACESTQFEIDDPLCGTGHIGDSFGSPGLFLHTITDCS